MERNQPQRSRQPDSQSQERGSTSGKLQTAYQRVNQLNDYLTRTGEQIAESAPDLQRTVTGTDLLVQRLIPEDRGHQHAADPAAHAPRESDLSHEQEMER